MQPIWAKVSPSGPSEAHCPRANLPHLLAGLALPTRPQHLASSCNHISLSKTQIWLQPSLARIWVTPLWPQQHFLKFGHLGPAFMILAFLSLILYLHFLSIFL